MSPVHQILKQYWGYEEFRPLQKEIIESVLNGDDTLAILPTGGGKSICFQVPALAQEGICIVISPLIALMKDQVENLKKRGIAALLIHSGMKRPDVIRTLKNASHEYFKFLYVSPERLETSLFKEYLPALNVNLIAVDEAHCISQWGYDFRPSYLRIASLREELPGVPVLGLTASATEEVQVDIMEKLHNTSRPGQRTPPVSGVGSAEKVPGVGHLGWSLFRQSFERKNLSYSVFQADSKLAKLVDIVKKVPGTGIIYCKSRKRTGEIMQLLQMHGIIANNYHAGLDPEERNTRQKDWVDNKVRVMVCTNAFGMGIDKPDVRFVVHVDIPDCLENYYQEAGRAGRDGKKSYAVLLYDRRDIIELDQLHLLRYPSFEQIKNGYSGLVNFLQIPAYSAEYKSFNFKFEDFTRNFKLNSREALYILKVLEQDGWIEFNERNFSPSTVVFTSSKKELDDFEKQHPHFEPLLTTLLRSYGGIFDFPCFVSEKLLAKLQRTTEDQIRLQLQKISSYGMISYTLQNDQPQIMFLKQRVPADEFSINFEKYHRRKESFIRRVQNMIAYTGTTGCRSKFINQYFGDKNARPCGICDNCLNALPNELSAAEFRKFSTLIFQSLQTRSRSTEELLAELKDLKKEKAWKILEFLQAENKIEIDQKGLLKLK